MVDGLFWYKGIFCFYISLYLSWLEGFGVDSGLWCCFWVFVRGEVRERVLCVRVEVGMVLKVVLLEVVVMVSLVFVVFILVFLLC